MVLNTECNLALIWPGCQPAQPFTGSFNTLKWALILILSWNWWPCHLDHDHTWPWKEVIGVRENIFDCMALKPMEINWSLPRGRHSMKMMVRGSANVQDQGFAYQRCKIRVWNGAKVHIQGFEQKCKIRVSQSQSYIAICISSFCMSIDCLSQRI